MSLRTEQARMNVAGLFKEIIRNKPPLTHLNLENFSDKNEGIHSAGYVILEALKNSSIKTIKNLNLSSNSSWFKND